MTKDFDEEFNNKFKNRIDDNIEEPNYLKDIFDSSIKKSKRKLLMKNTIKTSKVLISIFIVFIISILRSQRYEKKARFARIINDKVLI